MKMKFQTFQNAYIEISTVKTEAVVSYKLQHVLQPTPMSRLRSEPVRT
jgi:hypothetical protein